MADFAMAEPIGATSPIIRKLPNESGIYALIGVCRRAAWLDLASLGCPRVQRGYYTYVGSAHGPGGIRARVGRHLSNSARLHWHFDFLRPLLHPVEIWHAPVSRDHEHLWAAALVRGRGIQIAVRGFGASDCACVSHLFWSRELPSLDNFKRRLRSGVEFEDAQVSVSCEGLSCDN